MAKGGNDSKGPLPGGGWRAPWNELFEGCSSEAVNMIARARSDGRKVRADQEIFGPGRRPGGVCLLDDGWVFLYSLLPDGRRQILHFALPGAVLDFGPVLRSNTAYGARALTDAVVSLLPQEALDGLSRSHPEVGLRLAQVMSSDRSLSYDHLTSVGRRSARERVAHLLLELFVRARAQWPGHRVDELYLPLTQAHIGEATSLTGVHVNRVLRGLRKDGIVGFHYRRLTILDPDRLIDVSGIDPQLAVGWGKRGAFDE